MRNPFAPLLLLIFVPFSSFGNQDLYLEVLINKATEHKLWERRDWDVLLHYKPRLISSGVKSLVDARSFFLASNGSTDPKAELEATLKSFFADKPGIDEQQHAQCMFAARYDWLKRELNFDTTRLPEKRCERLDQWISELKPNGVSLIFPVAYLNSPASTFGHTLLRIDSSFHNESTGLLAQSVSYAARTQQERGIGFALKGLFGGYRGMFSVLPYYFRVKEYGDIENRDIWEYQLNLSPGEVRRMLLHLWELQSVYFDYFFIDENCSYHLLSLLEAARPSLRLTDGFKWYAIPADTIRSVTQVPGLLKKVVFRPSRRTMLQRRAQRLDATLQEMAVQLGEGDVSPNPELFQARSPQKQAEILELALDYAEYRKASRPDEKERNEQTALKILKYRNRLDVPSLVPDVPAPDVRPEQGHGSSRFGLGFGYEDSAYYLQWDYRLAYHDLLDPQGGFIRGAQLEFLQPAVRFYPQENRLNLERVDIVNIKSVPSRNRFLTPYSWKVDLGVRRMHYAENDRSLVGQLNGGIGVTYDLLETTQASLFSQGALVISDRLQQNLGVGAGLGFGLSSDISRLWRIGLSSQVLEYFQGTSHTSYEIALNQRLTLWNNSAVRFTLSRKREFGGAFYSAEVNWNYYF